MSISSLLRKPVPVWLLLVVIMASFSIFAIIQLSPNFFQQKGDFQLGVSSRTVFLPVNHTRTVDFVVNSLGGFTGVVRFSLVSPPTLNGTIGPGVLLSFDPVLNRVNNASYSFDVSSSMLGSYTLILTGMSNGKSHSISFSVPVQGLGFQASPNQLAVAQHSSANMTVTITSRNGYSGNLTLGASGPAGDLWITLISPTLNCSSCNGLGPPYPLSPNGTVGVIINVKWQSNGANYPGSISLLTLGVDGLFTHTFQVIWN